MGVRGLPLLNRKHNVGWFLVRRFVDLVRVISLHMISKNHSNTFLLINMQKTKSAKLQQGLFVFVSLCRFRQVSLHKKWSFQLRISSVNMTKPAVSSGFGHIYWRNPLWKTSFFVQCFYPIHNVYFNDVQISRSIHLSSSLWGNSLRCDLFRKRIDQTNFLL